MKLTYKERFFMQNYMLRTPDSGLPTSDFPKFPGISKTHREQLCL